MPRALAMLLVLSSMTAFQAVSTAFAEGMRVTDPRAFGYFVGDTFTRTVEIEAGPGETLDPQSLPRPGPLNYWLELRAVDVSSKATASGTVETVRLSYQSFYVPIDPKPLSVPAFTVRVTGGSAARTVTVPAISIVMSPLREIFPASSGREAMLRPDFPPRPIPTGRLRTGLLLSGLTSMLLIALLAYHRAWWPFRRPKARPFAEAARHILHAGDGVRSAEGYREALLVLHRAFDRANGHALLAEDVGAFLTRNAEYAALQQPIGNVFTASRLLFFGNDVSGARLRAPPDMVIDVASRLAAVERRAR